MRGARRAPEETVTARMVPVELTRFEQLKATGDLPSPKGVALAIIQMSLKEDVQLPELARIIKVDPAYTGKLIRAANGANAFGRRPVVSIQDALSMLGVAAVRSLVLGFSLMNNYSAGMCRGFNYREYWTYCLACALAMEQITAHTRAARPEETFSVGLLARIGELALATLYPAAYSGVLENCARFPDLDLVALEQAAFAINHRDLAAAMLTDWGLPKAFVDATFHHSDFEHSDAPVESRQAILTRSLSLARHIAAICLAEPPARASMMARLETLSAGLAFEREELGALCDRVVEEWRDWGRLLDVDTRDVPAFADLENAARAAPPVEPANAEERLRVLVAVGDPAEREALIDILNQAGHDVCAVADGRSAFDTALQTVAQMLIVDRALAGTGGLELTKALRATRLGRCMYIVMLDAAADEGQIVAAFDAGVDDCLTRPVSGSVLAARLRAGRRVIGLHREVQRDREEIRHFAAELAVTNRRLQEVALTDSLTGLPNRRYAIERLGQEWSASTRARRSLACMVLDVDNFKRINDTFGHDTGDAVLREVAAVAKTVLRSQDVVCRMGGDEFFVVCPDTGLEPAVICAERIRRAVEQLSLRSGGGEPVRASLSIGVAVRDAKMRDAGALIKSADRGVYLAKERGRNRVATAQPASS